MATRVLVLMGGPDAEHDVSLMSGREVAAALRSTGRYEVIEAVIGAATASELAAHRPDVVFPVLHGHWGEGGPLQEELESMRVPYVGSRPRAARIAMDKVATKLHASALGLATPRARELRPGEPCDIDPPVVLKPVDDGSSVDLRICRTTEEIECARREFEPRRSRLMAESYIRGREVTVGIVAGRALPLIEIVPTVQFYDYEAKYFRDDTRYILAPALPSGLAESLAAGTVNLFERLGCRDVARADFLLEEAPNGQLRSWFLEINTMPGFTTHSLVPMAAAHASMDMPTLCASLVDRALARGAGPREPATASAIGGAGAPVRG